jgi:hypothetical protein
LRQSAYIFELRECDSENGKLATAYKLTAVPRSPRMPEGSQVLCADETGTVKQINGGTSADCYDHGHVVVKPAERASENPPEAPAVAAPRQQPSGGGKVSGTFSLTWQCAN